MCSKINTQKRRRGAVKGLDLGIVPTSLPSVVFLQLLYGGRHYLIWSKPY
jgi:hypothetical protein